MRHSDGTVNGMAGPHDRNVKRMKIHARARLEAGSDRSDSVLFKESMFVESMFAEHPFVENLFIREPVCGEPICGERCEQDEPVRQTASSRDRRNWRYLCGV